MFELSQFIIGALIKLFRSNLTRMPDYQTYSTHIHPNTHTYLTTHLHLDKFLICWTHSKFRMGTTTLNIKKKEKPSFFCLVLMLTSLRCETVMPSSNSWVHIAYTVLHEAAPYIYYSEIASFVV